MLMLRITILLTSMVTIQLTLKMTIYIRILLKKADSFCCGIAKKGNHQNLQGLDAKPLKKYHFRKNANEVMRLPGIKFLRK